EIARGLDVFELVPGPLISQNEIDAAKTVHFDFWNTQDQQKFVWPPSFALTRAYLDQLERSKGLATDEIASIRSALAAAEKESGAQRKTALTQLASKVDAAAGSSSDAAKVHTLHQAIADFAAKWRSKVAGFWFQGSQGSAAGVWGGSNRELRNLNPEPRNHWNPGNRRVRRQRTIITRTRCLPKRFASAQLSTNRSIRCP